MFDRIHEMRTRIVTSPSFTGDRVLGAILFEKTMDREIEGAGTRRLPLGREDVVPFLKVDKGLADEADGAQVMKPMPDLDALLERARQGRVRHQDALGDQAGRRRRLEAVVDQQFESAARSWPPASCRSSSPRSTSTARRRPRPRRCSRPAILEQLDSSAADQQVMLKLTLPEADDFYADLVDHPNVLRVVALSGGYTRDEANDRLAAQPRA